MTLMHDAPEGEWYLAAISTASTLSQSIVLSLTGREKA